MHYIVETLNLTLRIVKVLSTKKDSSLSQKMQSVYGSLTPNVEIQKMN